MSRYNFFHLGKQPVLDDYIESANKAGLKLLSTKRFIPATKTYAGANICPRLHAQYSETDLSQVLEDIHCFRPDVRLTDLYTTRVMAVFVKEGMKCNIAKKEYENGYVKKELLPFPTGKV